MIFLRRFPAIAAILLFLGFGFILLRGYSALAQADAAMREEDYRAATESYADAARFLFWRDDLREQAAFAAIQRQDYPTAIYYFERAKLSERGQLSLAYAYYQTDEAAAAQRTFEKGAELYDTAPFYEGLAFIFHSQKKWAEERRALEKQTLLNDDDARAHYRLGVLLTLFEPDLALPELTRAAALDGQFDPASQTLRAALAISGVEEYPAKQRIAIGRALGLVEEWELALIAFGQAVEADPQNAEAWAWLGEAKQHTGGDGRAELDKALALDGGSSIIRGLRGLYWQRQEKYSQALAEYLLAQNYDPQNPAWHASIGETYTRMNDLVSALNAYQRATELAPSDAKYWRLLAVFCANNGVDVEGIGLPAAQKATELAPDDPQALDALGYSYYSASMYANAEAVLSDTAARFPDYYPAHLHLALNYLAQGNAAAAYQRLIYVRDADPNGEDGIFARRLLERYFP